MPAGSYTASVPSSTCWQWLQVGPSATNLALTAWMVAPPALRDEGLAHAAPSQSLAMFAAVPLASRLPLVHRPLTGAVVADGLIGRGQLAVRRICW